MIGWLSTLLTLASMALLGQHVHAGWLIGCMGNVGWMAHATKRKDKPVLAINVIMFVLNAAGYISWL